MSITIEWFDEEKKILLTTFVGQWTWDEVWSVHRQGTVMVKGLNHKVDNIYDLTTSNPFPPPGTLMQFRRSAEIDKPLNGITVIVKASRMVKAIANIFWRFYPADAERFPFEFAETVAEAHAVLMRYREERA